MTGPAPQQTDTQTEEKPAAPETGQPDLFLHPDDLELAELERLAAEEEKAAPVEVEQEPPPPPEPEPQPQPQPMIPKARLDEVLRQGGELQTKLDELARHNAYLAGQLEVLGKGQQPGQPAPSQPALDPVAEVRAKLKALGARYDAGEVSMEELLIEREALDEEARQARAEASRPDPAQEAARVSRDPVVLEATARMEAANPWFANIPQPLVQGMLVTTARDMLAERGVELTSDARSTLILRQAVIDVARMAGMDLKYGGGQQAAPPASDQASLGRSPSGVTPQERQAKVDLQNRLPPNTARVGTSQQIDPMSPERLAEMSDSDLAALPASVLDRLAAGSAR
jgi:hypothetical protein